MNKQETIKALADKLDVTQGKAKEIYDAFEDVILEGMKNDGKVTLLGSFNRVDKQARTGRNPKTGEAVQIEAHSVIKYKPSKMAKDYIR